MNLSDIDATLKQWFTDCPSAIVAFSGGVDSSLVAWLARRELGRERCTAVISASASLKLSDLDAGKGFCLENDIPLEIVRTEELLNPDYFLNPVNRCFFCKQSLYTELKPMAKAAGAWLLNGTNVDDLGDYRPGLQAADDFAVRSPLAECGIDKDGVRALAAAANLSCWDKPASPCLASRIPYGQQVTERKLRQVEDGEAILAAAGFPVTRIRHHGDLARIEVPAESVASLQGHACLAEIAKLGFETVEVDPEGFVSGKLNRVLEL